MRFSVARPASLLRILGAACLLSVGLLSGSAFAANYYVATNGSDTTGDGSLANPWATIQYAVGQAPDGSTILVRPGTYTGRTRFTRHFVQGLTVRSEVPYQAVLTSTNDHVITMYGSNVGASYITLEGFEIHSQPGNTTPVMVHLDGGGKSQLVHHITIRNNILHDSFSNDILKMALPETGWVYDPPGLCSDLSYRGGSERCATSNCIELSWGSRPPGRW